MKLDEALNGLAQDAGSYADADRILARARRLRYRKIVGGALAAMAVAAVAGTTGPMLWQGNHLRQAAPAASVSPLDQLGGPGPYPATVSPPTHLDPLPTDRGVGRAALIYTGGGNQVIIVTTDGHQYQLPQPGPLHSGLQSLSPDGRWLLDGSTLRDLTTTTVREVARGGVGWSSNSRWLLIDAKDGKHRVDTTTGASLPALGAVAVLDSGDVLVPTTLDRTKASINVVDPTNGASTRQFNIDATGKLGQDEGIAAVGSDRPASLYTIWPVGDRAWLQVEGGNDVVVLLVSLTDGHILSRTVASTNNPGAQGWAIAGIDSGRLVLRHRVDGPSVPPGATPYQSIRELAVATPAGDHPTVACTLPSTAEFLARGGWTPV